MDEFDYVEQRVVTYVGVNARLLYAALAAGFAWWAWPTSYEWWGFGLMSILTALAAGIAFVQATVMAFQLWRSESVRNAILRKGRPATANDLASDDKLRQSGLFGDKE